MTHWGLTADLRETEPWGLSVELLAPGKVITDPVHHDIHLSHLEVLLLNSHPLQRLRRVRQLGTSNLVYPGATHTRLSHSLGALCVAQRIIEVVEAQRSGPHPTPDLFGEWENKDPGTYLRRLAEAIVLARLGGLLHDLCHVPFGHTVEDDLGLFRAHDENVERFEKLWAAFPEAVRVPLEAGGLKEALVPLILSKADTIDETVKPLPPFKDRPPDLRYPFVRDVVGNTICADLMDYLQRDHLMTGLPASLGQRFLDGFYVAPEGGWWAERMVMRIARGNRERADIVTELFKYLRYRYEETERVLVHHAKVSADAMIGKLLAMWTDELLVCELQQAGVVLDEVQARDVDTATVIAPAEMVAAARVKVSASIEKVFLERGDDGILEHLVSLFSEPANKRQEAIAELTRAVLDRDLYKLIGRARTTKGMSREKFCSTFGTPEKKREIERRVAGFACLAEGWQLLLWIPQPEMRLKPADVKVTTDGKTIQPLKDHERHGAQSRAISDSHKALWGVSVYAPREVAGDSKRCSAILAEVSKEMLGLLWEGVDPIFEDAEAAIAAELSADYRLSMEAEAHLARSLRSSQAAALARRDVDLGGPGPGPIVDRTYVNLREKAQAFAEAASVVDGEGASAIPDSAIDVEQAGPGLFDDV